MTRFILISSIALSLLAGHAMAQDTKTSPPLNGTTHGAEKRYEKIPNSGNDCVAPAEKQGLKGAERKRFVAECVKRYNEEAKSSDNPAIAKERIAKAQYADCNKEFGGKKGSAEWAAYMRGCLEPTQPSRGKD